MTTNPNRRIIGRVRNIHPSRPAPTWEACFDASDYADDFTAEHEAWITIEWPSGAYRSMVGIKPHNPIYLRGDAVPEAGRTNARVSDLCIANSLDQTGRIVLEVVTPRTTYRLVPE
jgi:hypothetical protein